MKTRSLWMIPMAGVGLLAFLITYSLAGTRQARFDRPSPPTPREMTPPLPAEAMAFSGGPSSSLNLRAPGRVSSRPVPEAPVPSKETGGGHGPLGYLRDIPPDSGDAGRKEVIRRTAEHLGIPEGSRENFEKAAGLALSDMVEASQLQCEGAPVLGLLSPGSRKGVPSEASLQLQERYAARRAGALGRLEPYLGESPAGGEFRATFEAWVATVRLKGRLAR